MKQIPLTQGHVALVDDEDYDRVMAVGKWYAHVERNTTYARRTIRVNGKNGALRLHNFLTGWPLVDHINGNGLDNQRANLRPATSAENQWNRRRQRGNTSGYIGVSFAGPRGWYAYIRVDGVMRNLGHYATAEEAALVRDAAAREHRGEFARLNLPDGDLPDGDLRATIRTVHEAQWAVTSR